MHLLPTYHSRNRIRDGILQAWVELRPPGVRRRIQHFERWIRLIAFVVQPYQLSQISRVRSEADLASRHDHLRLVPDVAFQPVTAHGIGIHQVRIICVVDLDPSKRRDAQHVHVVEAAAGQLVPPAVDGDLEARVVRRGGHAGAELGAGVRQVARGLLQVPGVREDVVDEDVAEFSPVPVPPGSELGAAVGGLVPAEG